MKDLTFPKSINSMILKNISFLFIIYIISSRKGPTPFWGDWKRAPAGFSPISRSVSPIRTTCLQDILHMCYYCLKISPLVDHCRLKLMVCQIFIIKLIIFCWYFFGWLSFFCLIFELLLHTTFMNSRYLANDLSNYIENCDRIEWNH